MANWSKLVFIGEAARRLGGVGMFGGKGYGMGSTSSLVGSRFAASPKTAQSSRPNVPIAPLASDAAA
jgi:hypothetical protein